MMKYQFKNGKKLILKGSYVIILKNIKIIFRNNKFKLVQILVLLFKINLKLNLEFMIRMI